MKKLLIGLMVWGCAGTQTPKCSKEEATRLNAECAIRIITECKADDKACPAYIDCKRKAEAWRTCQ